MKNFLKNMLLNPSAAFWRINNAVAEPDHPKIGSDPFAQTSYCTENIQVLPTGPAISQVTIPAGSQLWKGLSHSKAVRLGYIQLPNQRHALTPNPQSRYSGFYGSRETAQTYSSTKHTEEDVQGIEVTFMTTENLKLIDIGDLHTINAILNLIETTTIQNVVTDKRYYYFLKLITTRAGWNKDINELYSYNLWKVAWILYGKNIWQKYFNTDGSMRSPLVEQLLSIIYGCSGVSEIDSSEKLDEIIGKLMVSEKITEEFIDELFHLYTYSLDHCNDTETMDINAKIKVICDGYFALKDTGFNQNAVIMLGVEKLEFEVNMCRVNAWLCLKQSLAEQDEMAEMTEPFHASCRYSINEMDTELARLIEQFVCKWVTDASGRPVHDGWIYISDHHAGSSNLGTENRSMLLTEDGLIDNTFHSEIYLTEQGTAKLQYIGYNRFDAQEAGALENCRQM